MEERGRTQRDRLTDRLTHGAPLAVLVAVILLIAYQLRTILMLIAIAMLVALVLRVIVNQLERLRIPGWLSVIILIAGIVAFGVLVWYVIVPNLISEIQRLISMLPQYAEQLRQISRSAGFVPDLDQLAQRLQGFLSQIAGTLPTLITTTASIAAGVVAVLFLAVYMAVNPSSLISGGMRLVPEERRPGIREFLQRLGRRMRGWMVGTVIVATFVGTMGGVGLWILGVPLALTFGIIAGVLNVVPFIGAFVGGLLPALVALTISPTKAVLVAVLFIAIQQIEGNLLQPLIMGREISVHPVMIVVSFLVFGTLLGVLGVLLAAPAAVLIAVIMDEATEREPSLGEEEEKEKSSP